jgi:hypothetical protein
MDGLRGPGLSGSGNYLNRSALLFGTPNQKGTYIHTYIHIHPSPINPPTTKVISFFESIYI